MILGWRAFFLVFFKALRFAVFLVWELCLIAGRWPVNILETGAFKNGLMPSTFKKNSFALVHFNSQGNFPHGGFMEMGCSSCRPWPEHYRKCIFMEDLLRLPTGERGGKGVGVCSVNGQLRTMMWVPSVKLNWFALSTIACSMLKEIVTDMPFPSVRTVVCWRSMTPYAEKGWTTNTFRYLTEII